LGEQRGEGSGKEGVSGETAGVKAGNGELEEGLKGVGGVHGVIITVDGWFDVLELDPAAWSEVATRLFSIAWLMS
jgi:hypothetical protein